MVEENLYELLQVQPSADPEIILAAFRRLILRYHPDRNPSPDALEMTQRLNHAYEILGDPKKREQYDRDLRAGASSNFVGASQAKTSPYSVQPNQPRPRPPGPSGIRSKNGLQWAVIGVVAVLIAGAFSIAIAHESSEADPSTFGDSLKATVPTASPNPNIGQIGVKEQQLAVIKSDITLMDRKIDGVMLEIVDSQSDLAAVITHMMGLVSKCNPSSVPIGSPFIGSRIVPDRDCDEARRQEQGISFVNHKLYLLQSELEELMAEREVLVHNQTRVESEIRRLR